MKFKTSLLVAFAMTLFAANTAYPMNIRAAINNVEGATKQVNAGAELNEDRIASVNKDLASLKSSNPGKYEKLKKNWDAALKSQEATKAKKSATIAEMPSKKKKSLPALEGRTSSEEKRGGEVILYESAPAYTPSSSSSSASASGSAGSVASPASPNVAEQAVWGEWEQSSNAVD